MSRTPVVFFDLDGTLTDPREGILRCIRYAFDKLDAPSPDDADLLGWIGPPLHNSFARELGDERAPAALRYYRERFAQKGMYENALYPDIPHVLDALRDRSRRLFVVTSKPAAFAAPIVAHFGIAEAFERVYGSELDGRRSDKGELIAYALRQESLDPGLVTMVGDRRHDIDGARQNAVRSVGVAWGYGSRKELESADAVCEAVPELPAMLGAAA